MKLSKGDMASLLIVATIIILGWLMLPILPDQLATHWNENNQVNGFMSKEFFVWFMSGLSILLFVVFTGLPRFDPLKKNVALFMPAFDYFKVSFFIFIAYTYVLTLAYNLGNPVPMVPYIAPGLALLFFAIGVLLEKARPNWFIGIRTPWTLSNEAVWNKTHAISGILFKVTAIIAMLAFFFPTIAFWLLFAPVILVAVGAAIYSYVLFTRQKKAPVAAVVKKVSKKKKKTRRK